LTYDELRERLVALPGATAEWLSYTLSFADGTPPVPTSYSLVRGRNGRFTVYRGNERGGVSQATAEDGETPLAFSSESQACDWIWEEIQWWRDFEARRAPERLS
jgi:hypothetical protein